MVRPRKEEDKKRDTVQGLDLTLDLLYSIHVRSYCKISSSGYFFEWKLVSITISLSILFVDKIFSCQQPIKVNNQDFLFRTKVQMVTKSETPRPFCLYSVTTFI